MAIGIVRRADGRVLICRRRADVHLGGCWEFPGGKVEPGESPAEATVRELAEETGLAVRVVSGLPPIDHVYTDRVVHLHPFLCAALAEPPEARPLACDEVRWVRPSELADHPFPPANAPLLTHLATELPPASDER